ncbi:MFS transporter [Stappia taiwanensis]|uniref:MFS transporter n=1 Tax=Stappia taiwanensis TaxID=992267 RepID=A0A838XNN1_9HYPH|nr:MFS transporter [Stappia taiwanensis]MBA4612115.1 MFS transporter [Stappia taiwanensis]GGE90985.1 hypothetical protein GCM10007285_18210 [Stappia taiwanensis]
MSFLAKSEQPSSYPNYRIWLDTIYLRSWLAVFLSMSGTFLLLLTLSTVVYAQTGSAFWSAAVFASQWVLAILSPPVVAWLAQRFQPVMLLAWADFLAAAVVIAAGLIFPVSLVACLVLLAIHGVLDAINRSLRVLPLKAHVPPEHLKAAVAYFSTAQYLAFGVGPLVGILLVDRLTVLGIAALDALSFVASGCLYLSFRKLTIGMGDAFSGFAALWRETRAVVAKNALLRRALLYLIVIVSLYQGFHNVARSEFAFRYLGMSLDGTMYVQLVASVGIVFGALLAGRVSRHLPAYSSALPLLIATALGCLAIFLPLGREAVLVLYGVFMALFEVAFMVCQAEAVAECPLPSLPAVNAGSFAAMTTGMMLMVFAGAAATDLTSLFTVALTIGVAALALGLLVNRQTPHVAGSD